MVQREMIYGVCDKTGGCDSYFECDGGAAAERVHVELTLGSPAAEGVDLRLRPYGFLSAKHLAHFTHLRQVGSHVGRVVLQFERCDFV